ncbi:uncharacterized protein LOC123542202 [Mercenaria mercenaria]|uniref:uncharacterized protein LOC123542202 n=1 Tax=Mercenaria mercenaria TaxID=6596 RepID=UPI001E1D6732|nr:uncharacterized protein LOC123542202 [Mercenaria mercenaria]
MICVNRYREILTIIYILFLMLKRNSVVECRAIMVEPPHRSSLWRFNYNTTVNLRDDSLNCGGYDWQWRVHQGRCGVCGDLWNGTQHNADRGQYDTGIIVRRYTDGHYINVTFEVSSNYLGYVEFRLCPRNSSEVVLDQSCFDRYPLWIDESHGTRYYIGSRGGIYDIHIRLPGGLVCRKCVLQWKYKTGYRYNGEDTCKCLGCGKQEQYVNCADIEITPTGGWPKEQTGSGSTQDSIPVIPVVIQPTRSTQQNPNTTIIEEKIDTSMKQLASIIDHTSAPTTTHLSPSREVVSLPPILNIPTLNVTSVNNVVKSIHLQQTHLAKVKTTSISPTLRTSVTSPSIISPSGAPRVLMTAAPRVGQQVITLDAIRREIVKKLGSEVTNGMKIFFTPPKETGQTPRPVTSRPQHVRLPAAPPRPEVPNTQFVSVSNILDRFYPNYITPLLFSLAQPKTSGSKTTAGCDVTSDEFRCKARGIYNQSPGISKWCEINCRASNCVTFMCECSCEDKAKSQNTSCHAIAEFHGVEGMDQWCIANCKVGYCPANTCSVEDCMNKSSNGEA